MTRFLLHGLVIESEVPLEARSAPASDPPDLHVTLRRGTVDAQRPDGPLLAGDPAMPNLYSIVQTGTEITAHFPSLFQYTLDESLSHAMCVVDPEANPQMASILCSGNVVSAILGLRGVGVLHASTVAFGNRAIAVAGHVGAGKSTLTALLCSAGATLVGDDVLRVDDDDTCFLGSTQLRLRPQAAKVAQMLGADPDARTADGRIPVTPPLASQPPQLAAIIVPRLSEDFDAVSSERLMASKAASELLGCARIFGWRLPAALRAQFDLATRLATTIPVHAVQIPWRDDPYQPELARQLAEACGVALAG